MLAFFCDEEEVYWGRVVFVSIRFSALEFGWEIASMKGRIRRAVRTCVLRISAAMWRNAEVKEYLRCTLKPLHNQACNIPALAICVLLKLTE